MFVSDIQGTIDQILGDEELKEFAEHLEQIRIKSGADELYFSLSTAAEKVKPGWDYECTNWSKIAKIASQIDDLSEENEVIWAGFADDTVFRSPFSYKFLDEIETKRVQDKIDRAGINAVFMPTNDKTLNQYLREYTLDKSKQLIKK